MQPRAKSPIYRANFRKRWTPRARRVAGLGLIALLVAAGLMFLALVLPGCISLPPPDTETGTVRLLVDDPRIRAVRLQAGAPAPYRGVLVSETGWEAILAALAGDHESTK